MSATCPCGQPVAPRRGTRGKQPSTCLDCRRPSRNYSRRIDGPDYVANARRLVQAAKDGDSRALALEYGPDAVSHARRTLRRAGVEP